MKPLSVQGEHSNSATEPIPTVQDLYAGCSQTEGELSSSNRPEDSSKVEDITSSIVTNHHQSRLHIWMKDHPLGQIIGNPYAGIQTRSSIDLTNHCHYAAFLYSIEP